MSTTTPNVASLFATAGQEGTLSPGAVKALTIPDIGAAIAAGLGVKVDDVQASEVTLVSMMPDDSGSMSSCVDEVITGHKLVIESLVGTKQKDSILAFCRLLNGAVIYPFNPIDQVKMLDHTNYGAWHGTPLYDETVILLGTVLAKAQEFADAGVPARTCTLLLTDGYDESSVRASAATVKKIVTDMLKQESHIVAGMGFDHGYGVDFRRVFSDMGIPDEWIMTPKATPSELRKAFRMFSQSAVRASQGAAAFSKTALGGFATP